MSDDYLAMGVLWAPWRFTYLEKSNMKSGSCIFVDLPNEEDDERNLILYRGTECFVMLNKYPYASGHLLIAPYQHTSEIEELQDETLLEINQVVGRCIAWLRFAYKPEGFNIGVNLGKSGGAGIPDHIHWHVVPRWDGDTNFMTVTASTRVIPQSLTDTYAKLKSAVETLGVKRLL